jgi:hypothetical protein
MEKGQLFAARFIQDVQHVYVVWEKYSVYGVKIGGAYTNHFAFRS